MPEVYLIVLLIDEAQEVHRDGAHGEVEVVSSRSMISKPPRLQVA